MNNKNERHFSAAELAGLPGLPSTEQGVRHRAREQSWPGRERDGRGGGREYPMSCLPPSARAQLAARELGRPGAAAPGIAGKVALLERIQSRARQATLERSLVRAAALSPRDSQRVDIRLSILTAFDQFQRASQLPLTRAAHAFAAAYDAGRITVPEEVKAKLPRVSPATLYNWHRGLKAGGVAALAGRYGNRKGAGAIDSQPELRELVIAMLADFPHAGGKHLMKGLKARFKGRDDIRLPAARSLQRWLKSWKRDNAQLFEAVRNPDAWKGRYMSAMGSASEEVVRLNQRWELDSTPGDLMLTDGRHALVGVLDVYPRRGRLLVVKTSKATAIATLVRRALMEWGVPEEAKTDQGADYTSRHVSMVLEGLEVAHVLCPPFQPWRKPHIERFFRTFAHDLVELLPGYIGHNVAQRKAIEERAAFSERLFQKDGVLEVTLSSADFQRICDEWCENVYQHEKHDGLEGQTPFERVAAWTGEVRRIADEHALDVLLAAPAGSGLRTVQKKGIEYDNTWFIHPALGVLVGAQVRIKNDPVDLGRLHVSNLEGEFVCWAEAPERTGIDRREVAIKGQALQRAAVQQAKRAVKASARRLDTKHIVNEILADRAEAAGKLARLPGAAKLHSTAALSQAAAAGRARRGPQRNVDEATIAAARARLAEQQSGAKAQPGATVTQLAETPRQRLSRWAALEAHVRRGALLCGEEKDFHELYPLSSEFKSLAPLEGDGNSLQERSA